jgi:hypothetical protein
VYEQVRHSLELRYDDKGEHRVKNISEPVHSYRILADFQEGEEHPHPSQPRQINRRMAIGGALTVCVIAVAIILGWSFFNMEESGSDNTTCTDHLGLPVHCPDDRK